MRFTVPGGRISILVILLIGYLFLVVPGLLTLSRTAALVQNLGDAADGKVDAAEVVETEIVRWREGEALTARVYRQSTTNPATAIVFVPGLTPDGILNQRFVAVARALAKSGYLVLTPDIPALRHFRLESESIDQISFWYRQLRRNEEFKARQVGLLGVSVGGTLSLLSVARSPLSRDADFVVCIGGYQSLSRCQSRWFSMATARERHGKYPVQFYGRWIAMLMALDALPDPNDRIRMRETLEHLLVRGKATTEMPSSAEGARWYRYAVLDESDDDFSTLVSAQLEQKYRALSAETELAQIQCPVFLVHGAGDELIPPEETEELSRRLSSADEIHLLYTPLISHTHPLIDRLGTWEKFLALGRGLWFLHSLVLTT